MSVDFRQWFQRLEERGAIWCYSEPGPHAIFSVGGWHSDGYFNSNVISQAPSFLSEICAEHFVPILRDRSIEPHWILTYPPYGVPFAYELASQLGCRMGYINSLTDPLLSFSVRKNERVLVVADDIVSGDSMRTMTRAFDELGLMTEPVRVCLGNLTGSDRFDGAEIISLFHLPIALWKPDHCPLCKSGSEAVRGRTLLGSNNTETL